MKIKQLKWTDITTDSKGRNGLIRTSGVDVFEDVNQEVIKISPITSKDIVAESCYIELPSRLLPQFIAELIKLQEGL